MANVFGDDVIQYGGAEGIHSLGDTLEVRTMTVKTSTAVKEFAVLVTPIETTPAHADEGLVTPLAADTDFAVYRMEGIATKALASTASEVDIPGWIKGTFKEEKIADYATLMTPANIARLRDIGIFLTPVQVVGE